MLTIHDVDVGRTWTSATWAPPSKGQRGRFGSLWRRSWSHRRPAPSNRRYRPGVQQRMAPIKPRASRPVWSTWVLCHATAWSFVS